MHFTSWFASRRLRVSSLIVAIAFALAACGGGGGSMNTTTPPPPTSNPSPTVTSLSPASVTAGAAATMVTINGTGFIQTSTVQVNQANRSTTFVSSTQLQVSLTAADLAAGGTAQITVVNPTPGGGASSAATFTVNNPAPVIASLSQSSVLAGSSGMTLTVAGTGFIQSSVVQWNQSARPTIFVSSTQLQVALTAADLSSAGTVQMTIVNSGPGGGTSPVATFTINNPAPAVTALSQNSATAGSAAFTLTITGTGFISGSTVQWNQANRATTYVSATQLQIAVSPSDLSIGGIAQIVVSNAAPGGGASSPAAFTIINPAPQLATISPTTVTTIAAGSTLTVNGSGFVPSSTIIVNGTNHTANYVSATEIQANLLASDVAVAGTVQVSVSNPTPGGGSTSAVQLTVVYPVPSITSLNPPAVLAGGPAFTLQVNGLGFAPSSVVEFNGANRTTTYVSATELTIGLTATDIASPGTVQISVVTGTPGGGTSTPATLAIGNYPVPAITTINPTSIAVNSPDTPVTMQGSGFTAFTTIQVNGSVLNLSGWNPNFLFFKIPAADLTSVGPLSITVSNPGTASSNAVTVNVTPIPAPTLSYLSPASAAVGSAGFTLTVSGSNFVPGSVVQWNGSSRATTYASSFQLTIAISSSDIQSLGNNIVTVVNPTPGGGTSTPLGFTTYLPLPTHDLVYDLSRNLLWASIPSSAGPVLGNSVVSIDPNVGILGTPIWVGSEPNKLAISDDDSTLWVSFLGTPSIRKVDLNAQIATSVEPYFPGGWGGNVYATDMAVMPGSPSTVAVAAGVPAIYDDAIARSKTGASGATYLAFGVNAATLYGFASGLSVFSLDSTGIASTTNLTNSGTFSNDLRYDNGRLYLTSGEVLDGSSGSLLGTFAASGPIAPDSNVGRAFILGGAVGNASQITAFDVNHFIPVGSVPVSAVQTSFNSPSSLTRWGQDGLAYRTDTQVFAFHSALVRDLSATPADLAVSISSPASSATGANVSIMATVTNQGPNTASNVTLVESSSANTIFVSANSSNGSCTGASVLRCNLGDVPSGATVSITLVVVPTAAGTINNTVSVAAPQPDPDQSNNSATSTISVTGLDYSPVPVLASISPQSALVAASTTVISVSGANFSSSSTVNWNGTSLPTTFVNSAQLTATIDASLLTASGSAEITVTTAGPGGGTSTALPFAIFQTVALDANDIVFDPFTRKLYASVPSTASQVTGNSIVSIDPLTGALGTPVFIGSEPTRLALSDNGQLLYSVLSGASAIRRMSLPTLTPGFQFTPTSTLFGAYTAGDLAVMPGNPNVLATVGYSDGIQVWDVTDNGATARPITGGVNIYSGSVLAWADPTNLYSNDEGLSPSTFHRFVVGPTSFSQSDGTYLDDVAGKIAYSGGLVFSDGGGVVDPSPVPPATPRLVGRFMNTGGGTTAVDTTVNRAFFLNQNSYGVNERTISAFDAARFTFTDSTELDGLTGDAFDLVRWGPDGLAFRTRTDFWGSGTGRIVLLHGPFVLPPSATPNAVPSISTVTPSSLTSPAANTWVTINGSQFLPGSVLLWNGSARSTVFVNSGQLRVAIPAADLAVPQSVTLEIVNPAPGGGPSSGITFVVN